MDIKKDIVKIEIDNVCRGCLSSNRSLKPMENNVELFFTILGHQQVPEESKYFNLVLCWECLAVLQKIADFQVQIQKSLNILLRKLYKPSQGLSKLKIFHKNDFDYTIEYNDVTVSKKDVITKKEPEFDKCDNIKEESCDSFENTENLFEILEEKVEIPMETNIKEHKVNANRPKKYASRKIKSTSYSYGIDDIDRYVRPQEFKISDVEEMRCTNYIKYRVYKIKRNIISIVSMKRNDMKRKGKVKDVYVKCSLCNKIVSESSIKDHWDEHRFIFYTCLYCNVLLLPDKENLLLHLKDAHSNVFTCVCGQEYRTRKRYMSHYKEFHKTFICDICRKQFNRKDTIEKHMRMKHLPIKCEHCPRTYTKKRKWREHYFIHHPEVKIEDRHELMYCVECDLKFQNRYLYSRHLRTAVAHVPRKEQSVPCPDCGKVFSRKTYMKNHYDFVHAQKSKNYCELCDKYFSTGYSVRQHKKYVHEKAEKIRNKMCNMCGRGFATNRTLINHIRTHTGEKPHKCSYCDVSFAQITARKSHEKTQHKNVKIEADLI